eukprot:s9_g46.t1
MSDRSRSPSERRRTRGIRGGPAARRRRLAYIDRQLEAGEIWDNIPVYHADPSSSSTGHRPPEPSRPPPGRYQRPREPDHPPPGRSQRPPEPKNPPSQGSRQQFLKTEDLPGVRVWRSGADHIPHEIWLEQVPVIQNSGRLIAVDWHQVTDTCRYSARNFVKASDSGQVPRDVASFYAKADRRKGPNDLLIILSHIEASEGNLQRVLRGTRQSRFPADFIFITERRCGPGGKTEVAQNLLHELNLRVMFDDNLEVAEEFCEAGGTLFHIKKPSLRGAVPRHCDTHLDRCKSSWNVFQHIFDFNQFIAQGR